MKTAKRDNDFVIEIYRWLLATDEKGHNKLEKKLSQISTDPKCNYLCRTQASALVLYIEMFRDTSDIAALHIASSIKCSNGLIQKKAMWRCAICDNDMRWIIETDKKSKRKEVLVDPQMCVSVMNSCEGWAEYTRRLQVFETALVLIKEYTNASWSVRDYSDRGVYDKEDLQECLTVWKKYKGVARSPSCIRICEDLWTNVVSPKPWMVRHAFIDGIRMIMQQLGGSKESLERINEMEKTNIVTEPYVKQFENLDNQWKPRYLAMTKHNWMYQFWEWKGEEPAVNTYHHGNGLEKKA